MSIAVAQFLLFYLDSPAALLMPCSIDMCMIKNESNLCTNSIEPEFQSGIPPRFFTICFVFQVISLINCIRMYT